MSTPDKTTGQALAKTNGRRLAQPTFPDPMELGPVFAQSGLFKDASDPAKAIVKIIAGQELGIGPMASMTGIHIIEGKPTLSANLLAAQVKRHPAYDYIVRKHEDKGCSIEFFQNGEPIGMSSFTHEDATKAGVATKQNYRKYPKAMMFARALSQGVRWYCPDVTAGSPAYVPEELGAEVDEEGAPVASEPRDQEGRTRADRIAAGLEDESGNVLVLTAAEAAREPGGEVLTPDGVEHPPEPDYQLTQVEARALFDRAKEVGVNGQKLSLYLTSLGVEHDPIRNIGTAVKALRLLSPPQAVELDSWLLDQPGEKS